MQFLVSIIGRVLALTDAVLAVWTTTPSEYSVGTASCPASVLNVCVNACGAGLVGQLQGLVSGGIGLLNGMLLALSAGCY